jgi:hypothetical protein
VTFQTLFILGAAVFITGLLATVFFYISAIRSSSTKEAPSVWRYVSRAVLIAFAAYMAGSAIGIAGGCYSPKSGNLCGIWGALGVGPLLSGIALWAYGLNWRKRMLG